MLQIPDKTHLIWGVFFFFFLHNQQEVKDPALLRLQVVKCAWLIANSYAVLKP